MYKTVLIDVLDNVMKYLLKSKHVRKWVAITSGLMRSLKQNFISSRKFFLSFFFILFLTWLSGRRQRLIIISQGWILTSLDNLWRVYFLWDLQESRFWPPLCCWVLNEVSSHPSRTKNGLPKEVIRTGRYRR